MKTKVALLNFAQWLPRAEWEGDVGWSPSIGLSLIASDVKREGFECDPIIIVCENKKVPESFFTYLQKERYDIIGIHSVGLYYDEYCDSILKKIKEIQPWVKIVVGGPDSVFFLNSDYVDFAVFGAGRQSFIQFLHAIENKSDIEKMFNLFL